MRLIDADALMPKLKFIREAEHQIYGKGSWGFASKCITAIEDAPTIEEPKKGKWTVKEGELAFWDVCSVCGKKIIHRVPHYKFCPNCGAKMEGKSVWIS